MNDWWDYLEHGWFGKNGQKGSEKKNHKYYARIPTGTKDGKLQTRKKYVSAETASKLRDDKYRKEEALNETPKEKKERMKKAKKRYNKKMAATRRKRAVQKGFQTVSRLLGKQMDFKKKPNNKTENKAYQKAGWRKSMFVPGAYVRKAK